MNYPVHNLAELLNRIRRKFKSCPEPWKGMMLEELEKSQHLLTILRGWEAEKRFARHEQEFQDGLPNRGLSSTKKQDF